MGFGNYGICDLWDFGIMGEGGRRGAKQREKGRARALVHHQESHMGEVILFKMLWEDGFWWEGMWKECKLVATGCRDCMKFNVGRRGFHPMGTISADRPWDHIIIDLIGQLKASERGFVFILIIVDVLTCYVVLKPLRMKGAKEITYALVVVGEVMKERRRRERERLII